MSVQIQLRRGTAALWTSTNPVMGAGEIGFETDTSYIKIGNGAANWVSLPYAPSPHAASTSNPHSVTKTQVGLGNVDNTSNATERAATATLTNKTLTAPILSNPSYSGTTSNGGTVSTIDINGGTIDGTVIGGASKAAGGFTDLTVTGNTTLGDSAADTVTINGVTTYAAGATVSGLKVTELNGGPLAGFRNRIINGGFDVWQRATSTALVTGYTCADRWYLDGGSAQTVAKSATPSSPSGNYYLQTTYSASSAYLNLGQAIESSTVVKMRGQVFSVWCWIKSTGTAYAGYIAMGASYSNSADSYASQITGVSLTVNNIVYPTTSWQRALITFTVPADAIGLKIYSNHSAGQSSGAILHIGDFQLEPGTVATPFEARPIGTELALCQRYAYDPYYNVTTANISAGKAYIDGAITTQYWADIQLPVTMRATPTLTAPTASNFSLGYPGSLAISTIAINNANPSLAVLSGTCAAGTVNTNYHLYRPGTTEKLLLTAEL